MNSIDKLNATVAVATMLIGLAQLLVSLGRSSQRASSLREKRKINTGSASLLMAVITLVVGIISLLKFRTSEEILTINEAVSLAVTVLLFIESAVFFVVFYVQLKIQTIKYELLAIKRDLYSSNNRRGLAIKKSRSRFSSQPR